ncbi:hypothetical protein HJ130_18130 [Vibrio parahaemolyticus]|nr:hypothetical protein [Vibrio parahaemolyticus]
MRHRANQTKTSDSKLSKSGDEAKLKAIGALAFILADEKAAYKKGGKPNASAIGNKIQEIMKSFDNNITSEIRKDISSGYDYFMKEVYKETDQ